MTIPTYIIIMIAISSILYVILLYNNLIKLKNNIQMAWSNIDVLLKQRHDELPKLVEACKQYMKHEKGTLENVIEARNQVMTASQANDALRLGQAETQLRTGLGNLFALAENYPQLKADTAFQQLQTRISALENSISDRRELYNDCVNLNNMRIEQIPDVLIANAFGFKAAKLLEFSQEETKDINLKELF